MKCPRDQSELKAKEYEANTQVDVCPQCEGMFLDKGELETIQEAKEHDHSAALAEAPDPVREMLKNARSHKSGPAACPKCGAEMTARSYGFGSQIEIDVCPDDCGIWLDKGEIEALEVFFERSQAENPIPLHWRAYATLRGLFHKAK